MHLPGVQQGELGFFGPVAQNPDGRLDGYAPHAFKYQISARQVGA